MDISQLWVDPGDIRSRDLYHGSGGAALAPKSSARYEVIKVDSSGFSRGYDVRDAESTQWSVKLGAEAQSEVAASRILWAIGYHQPPTYLVSDWQLSGTGSIPAAARFRREQPSQRVVSEWSWNENPFVGTQPYRGLIVANLILNNWDWKTSNNKVYEVKGSSRDHRMYIVRDIGASFGKTSFPAVLRWTPFRLMAQGSRNDIDDFEDQQFITSRRGDDVTFDYRGIHTRLVDLLTIADVEWTCRLLARISDRQWDDVFWAAGYDTGTRRRFIAHLEAKIQQGLAAAKDPAFRAASTRAPVQR